MASTKPHLPSTASLASLPAEIVQDIFWRSLELSLCLVSKKMYQALPSYRRLSRFLPVLAFGSDVVVDKIIANDGDDCSDVVKKLGVSTPLSTSERVELQLAIFESGWFEYSSLVDTSRILEEYLIRHLWIEKDIIVEPDCKEMWAERNDKWYTALDITGHAADGEGRRLRVDSFEVCVVTYGLIWSLDGSWGYQYAVRLLQIQCIPDQMLTAPLPRLEDSASISGASRDKERLRQPMPHIFRLLEEIRVRGDPAISEPLVVSPKAVENAIVEAITTYNYYIVQVLTTFPLSADGVSRQSPVQAEHFIAAAKQLDSFMIAILMRHGSDMLPSDDDNLIAWAQQEPLRNDGHLCTADGFIRFLRSVGKQKARKPPPYVSLPEYASANPCRHESHGGFAPWSTYSAPLFHD
jgi:hypothetical protein